MDNTKKEPIHVHLVNPPMENPWRTQGDYIEELKRTKHLYKIAISSMYITLLGVIATAIIAITALRSYVAQ